MYHNLSISAIISRLFHQETFMKISPFPPSATPINWRLIMRKICKKFSLFQVPNISKIDFFNYLVGVTHKASQFVVLLHEKCVRYLKIQIFFVNICDIKIYQTINQLLLNNHSKLTPVPPLLFQLEGYEEFQLERENVPN